MDPHKILVVEDEAIIALEIKMRLQTLGPFEVILESTGAGALTRIKTEQPHVILMDMLLRGDLDGIDTAREVRKSSGVPIIFMTGNSHMRNDERLESTQPYWFLVKPVPDYQLLETINLALS
jgi:CheY-like chemotaxis protein